MRKSAFVKLGLLCVPFKVQIQINLSQDKHKRQGGSCYTMNKIIIHRSTQDKIVSF